MADLSSIFHPYPDGWQFDDMKNWWMPDPKMRVDADMKFPHYTDNVGDTMKSMGITPRVAPGGQVAGYSWVNPGSEFSRPWGTTLLPHNPPQWLIDHENHHLDGYIHPGGNDLWRYVDMLRSKNIKEPQ